MAFPISNLTVAIGKSTDNQCLRQALTLLHKGLDYKTVVEDGCSDNNGLACYKSNEDRARRNGSPQAIFKGNM